MDDDASTPYAASPSPESRAAFAATHWTVVSAAGHGSNPAARDAFGELYTAYLPPLRTYLRYQGRSRDEALELLQGFFEHLLASEGLSGVERKGRFRSWLLRSLNNFIRDKWRERAAIKRAGTKEHLPIGSDLETGEVDPLDHRFTPAQAYDRKWAITLLQIVLEKLAREFADAGKRDVFDDLKVFISGKDDEVGYREIAERRRSKPNTIAVEVKRLRERYAELLWAELRDTTDAEMIEEEWRHLQAAIAGRQA